MYAPMNNDFIASLRRAPMYKSFLAHLILEDETKNIIVTVFSFPVIRHVLRVFANLNFPPP